MDILRCNSPLGDYEVHCDEKQMKKIAKMFKQEMDDNRTDAFREP